MRRPTRRRHFEFGKLKAGRNRTSDQRPVTERLRRLPRLRRHDGLWALAGRKIVAQRDELTLPVCSDSKFERRAGVKVPDFDNVDTVPVRALAARQQKINRSRRGTSAVDLARIAKHFAEMPALRMRFQIERPDYFGGGECGGRWFEHFGLLA